MLRSCLICLLALFSASRLLAAEKPEIFVQLGHSHDIIRSVAFSPDGKTILSAGGKTVKLWEAETGKEVYTLVGHGDFIDGAVFSGDGRQILSSDKATPYRRVVSWDFSTGKAVRENEIAALRATLSLDGKYVVGGVENDSLGLWDAATGKKIKTLKSSGKPTDSLIEAIGISGNNRYVVSSHQQKNDQPGILRIWDTDSGALVKELKIPDAVSSTYIAVSPSGMFFLSDGWGKDNKRKLLLWDMEKGQVIRTVFICESGNSAFGIFSPDEKYLLFSKVNSNQSEFLLCLADLKTGREMWSNPGHSTVIESAAFAPDGKSILTGGSDGTLRRWDLATGAPIRTFAGNVLSCPFGFSPQKNLMLAGSNIWQLSTGKIAQGLNFHQGADAFQADDCLRLYPDGRHLLLKNQNLLLDFEKGQWTEVFPDRKPYLGLYPVLSRDGRTLLAASEGTLLLWDIEKAKTARIIQAHDAFPAIEAMAFSPDGRFILSGGVDNNQGTLKLWEVKSGRNVWAVKLENIRASSLDFSPDGKTILLGDGVNDMPVLYDASNGRQKKVFHHSDRSRDRWDCLAIFSPDGSAVLSADRSDHRIVLWDAATGKEITIYEGHSSGVYALEFFPDGKHFLSWSFDGTTRLWDISGVREIAQFITFTDGEWIVITPEGYFNASAKGATHLNVRVGNKIYSIDQFYSRFYRPELVQLALAGKELPKGESLTEVLARKPAPAVQILAPQPGTVDRDSASLSVKITDNGGGIGNIQIYLNGSQVANDTRGIAVEGKEAPNEKLLSFTVPLLAGQNDIKVIAFNQEGSMESIPAILTLVSQTNLQKPDLVALVVGINEYKNKTISLAYAVSDAKGFADILRTSTAPLFKNIRIQTLTTLDETSKESVTRALEEASAKAKPNDLFVFYNASHGIVDVVDGEDQYFLLTSNVANLSSRHIGKDAMSQKDLARLIGNIPAQKKLVILDTCNAGKGGKEIQVALLQQTRGLTESTAVKILQRSIGSSIFSASSDTQQALEGYQGHGLFTYVLIEGLKGKADKAGSGYVKTTDLADYLDSEVPAIAERIFNRAQYPTIEISGNAFPIGKVK